MKWEKDKVYANCYSLIIDDMVILKIEKRGNLWFGWVSWHGIMMSQVKVNIATLKECQFELEKKVVIYLSSIVGKLNRGRGGAQMWYGND